MKQPVINQPRNFIARMRLLVRHIHFFNLIYIYIKLHGTLPLKTMLSNKAIINMSVKSEMNIKHNLFTIRWSVSKGFIQKGRYFIIFSVSININLMLIYKLNLRQKLQLTNVKFRGFFQFFNDSKIYSRLA